MVVNIRKTFKLLNCLGALRMSCEAVAWRATVLDEKN